jgi:hypothetical protein
MLRHHNSLRRSAAIPWASACVACDRPCTCLATHTSAGTLRWMMECATCRRVCVSLSLSFSLCVCVILCVCVLGQCLGTRTSVGTRRWMLAPLCYTSERVRVQPTQRVRMSYVACRGLDCMAYDATLPHFCTFTLPQAPLCYPAERSHRFKSVTLSSQWQPGTGLPQHSGRQAAAAAAVSRQAAAAVAEAKEEEGAGAGAAETAGSREQQAGSREQQGGGAGAGGGDVEADAREKVGHLPACLSACLRA